MIAYVNYKICGGFLYGCADPTKEWVEEATGAGLVVHYFDDMKPAPLPDPLPEVWRPCRCEKSQIFPNPKHVQHPDGAKCMHCVWSSRCEWLLANDNPPRLQSRICDWIPSRFQMMTLEQRMICFENNKRGLALVWKICPKCLGTRVQSAPGGVASCDSCNGTGEL